MKDNAIKTPIFTTTYWGNEDTRIGLDEVIVGPRKLKIEFTTLLLDKKSFNGNDGKKINYIDTKEGVSFLINMQGDDKKFSIYNNFWLSPDKMYVLAEGLLKLKNNFDPDATEGNRIEIEKISRDNKVSVLSFERLITSDGEEQLILEIDNGQNINIFPLIDDNNAYKFKASRKELIPKHIDLILDTLSRKLRDTVDDVNSVLTSHYRQVYFAKRDMLGYNNNNNYSDRQRSDKKDNSSINAIM